MIVSINQPAYLPWLGYFHRIAVSDLHIVLDHVQFEKNSFTNRNKLRTATGWTWLTVPLRTSGRFGELPINRLETGDGPWRRKHWDTIRFAYAKAPYFIVYEAAFRTLLDRDWPLLGPLMEAITAELCAAFGITTRRLHSARLGVGGAKSDLVLNLCREVGATTYLSGPLGRDYLDPAAFERSGIRLAFHEYRHPVYRQIQPDFEPAMAALDLLFNHGPESVAILRDGQAPITEEGARH